MVPLGMPAAAVHETTLSLHGARWAVPRPRLALRSEGALAVALRLDRENRKVAKWLSGPVLRRLARHCVYFVPTGIEDTAHSLVDRLVATIRPNLSSPKVVAILNDSWQRFGLLRHIADATSFTIASGDRGDTLDVQAQLFTSAIGHRVLHNGMTIDPASAVEVAMDDILAIDLVRTRGASFLTSTAKYFCDHYRWVSTDTMPVDAIELLSRKCAQNVWMFALALCHRFLFGENKLTAQDAYWLGLVDGVVTSADAESDSPLEAAFGPSTRSFVPGS